MLYMQGCEKVSYLDYLPSCQSIQLFFINFQRYKVS